MVLSPLLYIKSTDWQNYLHAKSAHPYLFKESITYSQALTIKRICSTFAKKEKKEKQKDLLNWFLQKGFYKSNKSIFPTKSTELTNLSEDHFWKL